MTATTAFIDSDCHMMIDGIAYIALGIAVHEDHQNRGIGKQLVRHAIHNAKLQGYRTIEVGTGNSGIGQLALYQKCGFRMIGIDRDFFVRHYAEEIFENGIPCRDMVRLSQEL
jgi:ribosomal protein S18 acetylase RimI-like enzyme